MSAPGPAIRLGILVPSSNSNAESITAQMLKHESDISVHYTRFPLPANPDEPFNVGMLGNAPALLRDAEVQAVALHGTVYAPTSSIDLSLTSVTETVVDRGVVVRHLVSTMTPAAGAPAMISVPAVGRKPRTMGMTATDAAGRVLGRADVTFADSAGTRNGDIPQVVDWFVN